MTGKGVLAPIAVGQLVKMQQLQEMTEASKNVCKYKQNMTQSTDWPLHLTTNTAENIHISTQQGDITSNSTTDSNNESQNANAHIIMQQPEYITLQVHMGQC